jgi:hypothetical protein
MEINENIEVAANSLSILTSLKALAGLGAVAGAGIVAAGHVPRAGPLRAVGLALLPKFRPLMQESRRRDSIDAIRKNIETTKFGEYIVVTGSKGVGKSTAIDTAIHRRCGVVHVNVSPGKSTEEIEHAVYSAIARMDVRSFNPHFSASRVLWWYRFMFFGARPILILHTDERTSGDPYAMLTGAVRHFADALITVIIDASPNSLPPSLLTTTRERVIEIDEMPPDLMRQEFPGIFVVTEPLQLDAVVAALVGGVPSLAQLLSNQLAGLSDRDTIEKVVEDFARRRLDRAVQQYNDARRANPKMEELYRQFRGTGDVSYLELERLELELPSPDKTIRKVLKGTKQVLVPADPAMHLVLRHGLREVPTLEQLRELVRSAPAAG